MQSAMFDDAVGFERLEESKRRKGEVYARVGRWTWVRAAAAAVEQLREAPNCPHLEGTRRTAEDAGLREFARPCGMHDLSR